MEPMKKVKGERTRDRLPLSVLLVQSDAHAQRYQKFTLGFLAASLTCGAIAGFIALLGQPWLILACLLALLAMGTNLISTRLQWRRKWHQQRTLNERLHSLRWLFITGTSPYAGMAAEDRFRNDVNEILDFAELGEIDAEMWRGREPSAGELLEWYTCERISDQYEWFKQRSKTFRRRSRALKYCVSALYVAVGGVAVLEVFGLWHQHILGPTIAVVTSLQVWAGAREWGRTARVYRGYAYELEHSKRDAAQFLEDSQDISMSQVNDIVSRVEHLLADETTRWLALNDYDLYHQHTSSTKAIS